MKANELRTGNWVNNNEECYQITSATIVQLERKESTAKPIPLTAEWLERLGFRTTGPKLLFLPIPKHGMEIHYEMKPYGNVVTLQSDFGMLIPNDIQYIHQLQNLFFALTGEELTMKEETK